MVLPVLWIYLVLNWHEAVDHDVLHPRHNVSLNNYLTLQLISQVLLEVIIAQSVSFFVNSVRLFVLHLQTLVGKVNCQVFSFYVVHDAACAQVPWKIVVDFVLGGGNCPHSNVKLPAPVEQGSLNILLNNALSAWRPTVDKTYHFIVVLKNLNAPSLICVSWFDEPRIVNAVLHRHLLSASQDSSLYLLEPLSKVIKLHIVRSGADDESSRRRVELWVVCSFGSYLSVVVLLQAPDQPTLGA